MTGIGSGVRVPFVVAAASAVLACSGRVDTGRYPEPQQLLEASVAAYRRGDCKWATAGFERLLVELPTRDERRANARYYRAECLMDDDKFLEAGREFRRVSDNFSQHTVAADALLREGDAYAELWKRPALDPEFGETAFNTYRELLGRYPTSAAAARAQLRIAELSELFAEKDYKNGVFYFRLRAYDSAIIYFKDIVARYPQASHAPKAVERLVEIYRRVGYDDERQEMCDYLWRFYEDAARDLDTCRREGTSP